MQECAYQNCQKPLCDFHYNIIKPIYSENAKLLFTDTDSLMYEITAEDVYKDLYKRKEVFDNSDYSEDSPYYFKENKKVIGKMKDKTAGVPIVEFIGLQSKMYSYIKVDNKGGETAKGIKKYVIKKILTILIIKKHYSITNKCIIE